MEPNQEARAPAWQALVALFLLTGCFGVDFSPDGKRIAAFWAKNAKQGGLVVLDAADGGIEWISDDGGLGEPRWSPDGKWIAFANSKGLCLYDVVRKKSRLVLEGGGELVAWSADGSRLATLREAADGDERVVEAVFLSSPIWAESGRARVRSLGKGKTEKDTFVLGESASDSFKSMEWVESTGGVTFLDTQEGNVWFAAPGEARRATTTGDVIGLRVDNASNAVRWARLTDPKKIPAVFEMRLADGSVRRVAAARPFGPVTGMESVDRLGVLGCVFSPEGDRMVLSLWGESGSRRMTEAWVCAPIGGGRPSLLARLPPLMNAFPGSAAWSRDGKSVAIWSMRERIELRIMRPDGSGRRVFRSPRIDRK